MRLTIDIADGSAEFRGARRFERQWVEFYALLASARLSSSSDGWLSSTQLSKVGLWRRKKLATVGKEVARHMRIGLGAPALSAVLEHRGRTTLWRLSHRVQVVLRPSRNHVESWLRERTAPAECDRVWTSQVADLLEALTALEDGKAEQALHCLDEVTEGPNLPRHSLEPWRTVLRARAALQQGEDDVLEDTRLQWAGRTDPVGRAVRGRLLAERVFFTRDEEGRHNLVRVLKAVNECERSGDVATAGVMLNVAGVLARRLEDLEVASEYHRRAVLLSGLVGDYRTLQGALFNLALCRGKLRARCGLPPDNVMLRLVELCLRVSRRFGVGNDSAEAEIQAARWALHMGHPDQATSYLRLAEELIKTLEADRDQAAFLLARAEIHQASGSGNPGRDCAAAERIYARVGDKGALLRASRMAKILGSHTKT